MSEPRPAGVIVTGPNHALHFVLSLLTFWFFGGWLWVWLVVALFNRRRIQTVDEHGRVISPPGEWDFWWVRPLVGVALLIVVLILLV